IALTAFSPAFGPIGANLSAGVSTSVKSNRKPAQVQLVQRAIFLESHQCPVNGMAHCVMSGRNRYGKPASKQLGTEIGITGKPAAVEVLVEPERGAHRIAEKSIRLAIP